MTRNKLQTVSKSAVQPGAAALDLARLKRLSDEIGRCQDRYVLRLIHRLETEEGAKIGALPAGGGRQIDLAGLTSSSEEGTLDALARWRSAADKVLTGKAV